MSDIEKVEQYISQSPVFYLTSIDKDKPKCRPLGLHMLIEDKIYFGIGTFKDVYKQLQANPNVEICVCVEQSFLRYYGRAVFEADDKIANMAISRVPFLQKIYNAGTGKKLAMFHLESATAEFRTMTGIQESIAF